MGQKLGAVPLLVGGKLHLHLTRCHLVQGLPPYQVASWSIQPFSHNRNRPKIGDSAPFWGEELGPHLAQCGLDRGPPACQVPPKSIQPFGHNRRAKNSVGLCPFFWGRARTHQTPGPSPTSIPSGVLVHPAVCPQRTLAENWGLCPFRGGELGPHLTQLGWDLPPYQLGPCPWTHCVRWGPANYRIWWNNAK